MLTVWRGAALYIGALIGPGLLLVPALAAQAAGPASILAWAALLILSAPIAITFAALGTRNPTSGGVATYVREAFGSRAGAVTGACFLTAVVLGGPTVALIGGYYVADLTGARAPWAIVVAVIIYAIILLTNAGGLSLSSAVQFALSSILVVVVALAVVVTVPAHATEHWSPFAPHGWWAVGSAAGLLMWLVIGWEAMAQLGGDFRDPARDVPRAMAIAYGVICVLYAGLGVATVVVPTGSTSKVPLAELIQAGFGRAGHIGAAVLAVALTMGTMNVYTSSAAKLAATLAREGALPAALATRPSLKGLSNPSTAGDPPFADESETGIPHRPLVVLALTGVIVFAALAQGILGPSQVVRATSACFIAVYLLTLAAATRVLAGTARNAAWIALAMVCCIAVFSGPYLLVPLGMSALVLARRPSRTRAAPAPISVPE